MYALIFACSVMIVLWFIQRKTKDASIVDFGWSAIIGILAIAYSLIINASLERKIIFSSLFGIWSARLSYYLLTDRVLSKEKDGRYKALNEHWGEKANHNFFYFFQAQALLAVLLAGNVISLLLNKNDDITYWEYLGISIWIFSFLGESLADKQLQTFKQNKTNKGKTCRVGLWKYSRHPNYFFEWMIWFSYAVMSIGSGSEALPITIAILMYFFVNKFTGIPYNEIQALKSRGLDYQQYQKTTNAFVPWFPRNDKEDK